MSPRPRLRHLLLVAALPALVGCPRDLETPPRGEGAACASLEQCNPDASCGLLRACVDERCEATPSVVVPCPDGDPVFLPDAGS